MRSDTDSVEQHSISDSGNKGSPGYRLRLLSNSLKHPILQCLTDSRIGSLLTITTGDSLLQAAIIASLDYSYSQLNSLPATILSSA